MYNEHLGSIVIGFATRPFESPPRQIIMTARTHQTPPSARKLWSAYFALQTMMCAAWWVGLLWSDEFAALFTPRGHVGTLRLFWLADMVCVVGGSALSALFIKLDHALMLQALWWTSGAISFATLYCLAVWIDTQQAALAIAMMAPATLLTLTAAQHCSPTLHEEQP